MNRGNKCLFYLSDPKTEIGNSFDMTFSGVKWSFFSIIVFRWQQQNKHICMDKRQTGTYYYQWVCCCKQKAWRWWPLEEFVKAMYENSKFQYHLLMHWEIVSLFHWCPKKPNNLRVIFSDFSETISKCPLMQA